MTNDLKWLMSSDQQIPYHDKRTLDLYFQVMKWFKPHVIDLAGDQSDQFCFSRWSDGRPAEFLEQIKKAAKDPEAPDPLVDILQEARFEEKPVAEFYQQHRSMNKKSEIFVALGNHDVRAFDYFEKKIPELLDQVTPESLWGLDSLGIDYIYYNERPKHRYGGIHVHHGMSISKHGGESVKNDMDNFGVSMVRGHSHRLAQVSRSFPLRNNGKGETIRGYELGHMMDIYDPGAAYDNVHNWQQGFAIGHIESGGSGPDGNNVHIQLIEVSPDYTCFVEGRKFSA
jgi:hypothetical protein